MKEGSAIKKSSLLPADSSHEDDYYPVSSNPSGLIRRFNEARVLLLKALAVRALISRLLTARHCPSHVDLRRHQNPVNKWRGITSDPNAPHAVLNFRFSSFPSDGRRSGFHSGGVVVVVVGAALKMSNSSKMSSEPPQPPPAESTPLTRQTRSASPVIYFCWLRRRLCCTAAPRGFSKPAPWM